MTIERWQRSDNLPFQIGLEFEYIIEESELVGHGIDKGSVEFAVVDFVEKKLINDYPRLFSVLTIEDLVWVEYYPFESESYCSEEDEYDGYATYIHFHHDVVEKMVKHVMDKHPEHVFNCL